MSEVFEAYEKQYCELSTSLSRKFSSAALLPDGEEKIQDISEIKAKLEDADALIRKMDLEARSLMPSSKAMLLAKLREYKADLKKLKLELKQLMSANANQSHAALVEAENLDAHVASGNQRDRLMTSTERLNQSSDRIRQAQMAALETEQHGVLILEELHGQRETLLHAHTKLHGVDDAIDKSKRVLTSMSRRISRNKVIFGSLIVALVLVILIILYFKLSHH